MCGLQTERRIKPENPEGKAHQVLYYDGKIYNGWQRKDYKMTETLEVLRDLISRKISIYEAEKIIDMNKDIRNEKAIMDRIERRNDMDCQY